MEKKYPAIAARERGPGPGHYALPPTIGYKCHDFTKPTSPAYSFNARLNINMQGVDSSPGPRYYVDSKITRFGKDGTPAHSMLKRVKQRDDYFRTPGPGTYNPENAPYGSMQRRAPAYTMGQRTPACGMDTGRSVPAPNRYTLPPFMGPRVPHKKAMPSFSISAKSSTGGPTVDLANTPGPCRYNVTDPRVYLRRQPAFSMLGKHMVPRDKTQKPGPATYCPEKVTIHKPRAPAFTAGYRHSEYITPVIVNVDKLS